MNKETIAMGRQMAVTRGERNHNPLNIRRSPRTRWQGQAAVQNDKEFVQFESDLMGYRAAFRILHTYINYYLLVTVSAIINRWAPPEDGNSTWAYVKMVCDMTNHKPGDHIDYNDEQSMLELVVAMARVESGVKNPDMQTVRLAYWMARGTNK